MTMNHRKPVRLNEISSFKIFAAIDSVLTEPIWEEGAEYLDMIYGDHSGQKIASSLLYGLLSWNNDTAYIKTADIEKLANAILTKYAFQWAALYEALTDALSSDPLIEYERHDVHSGKDTETQTPKNWATTSTGLKADNQTETDKGIYGLNSSSASDSEKETVSTSHKNTTEQTGTFETGTEYGHKIDVTGRNRSVAKLMDEYQDFTRWNYWDRVFDDIDSMITLDTY